MSDYRSISGVHGLEPTIDWRALFVLSTFLCMAICFAIIML